MLGKTHEFVGIATAITIISFTMAPVENPLPCVCLGVGAMIGSYFPDIDTPTSAAGDKFLVLTFPFYLMRRLLKILTKPFKALKGVNKMLSHRGIFHSVLLYTLFFFLFWHFKDGFGEISTNIILGLFLGILTHLITDFITGGIMVFSPIYNEKIIPPIRFKSGGIINTVAIIASTLVIAFDIYRMLCNLG